MIAIKLFFLFSIALVTLAQEKVIVGYLHDSGNIGASKIDFSKVTHINYAFGIFDEDNLLPRVENENELAKVVEAAHKKGTKVLVSLGGWTGSKSFSPIMKNPVSRSTFASMINKFINDKQLDGIDIDWESPGVLGDNNAYDPKDADNYLDFLYELRALLGKKLITAAVTTTLFEGAKNGKEFGELFDFISIMSYDFNMPSSNNTGPNAGLDFEVGKGNPTSVRSSVQAWISAGVPANKLVLGLPFYGTIGKVSRELDESTGMYANRVANTSKAITWSQIKATCLNSNGQADNGYVRYFDQKSQTPWLFNKDTKVLVSYDDPESLTIKCDYANDQGLLGVMIWQLHQDSNNELLNVVQVIRGGPRIIHVNHQAKYEKSNSMIHKDLTLQLTMFQILMMLLWKYCSDI